MQELPSVNAQHPHIAYSNLHYKSRSTPNEIVEISSDEDEDMEDGQPESSKTATTLSPKVKRAVYIDDNDEDLNNWGSYFDAFPQFDQQMSMKRQKLDHNEDVSQVGVPSSDADMTNPAGLYMSQHLIPKDEAPYTQSPTSFDELSRDNVATLAFRLSTPFKTSDVQNPEVSQPQERSVSVNVATSQGTIRLEAPPYYEDQKLGVRLYRGPGYEKFPIVLGTVSEHQDICDHWDRIKVKKCTEKASRRARKGGFSCYVNDEESSDEGDAEELDEVTHKVMELECLHKIREVLPDIEREFALGKVRDHIQEHCCHIDSEIQVQPNAATIVSDILELPDYPRQEKLKHVGEPAADGTGITIHWVKGDEESKNYAVDAVCLLATQFEHVPTHFIHHTVQRLKTIFAAYLYIHDIDMNYHYLPTRDRPYRRSVNPRVGLEKKYMAKESETRSKTDWNNLVNELQAARQQTERNRLLKLKAEADQAIEEANLNEHKTSGNVIECQCCFDDEIPINRAVSCEGEATHWFCFACVLGLAENQVGSMKHETTCMDQSGCEANLCKDGVGRAIPKKLFDKLAFYQQQSEITAACIEGLEQCPFCDFKAICDPIEYTSVFQCQNPECQRISCRKCQEESHLPKTCEEMKSDRKLSARHQVEEARSEAMMRKCPRCKVKIVKEIGCNKMRCGQCGCIMCYVCQADISQRRDGGYGHFNDAGAKCTLYDKDFDRHEFEADEAEKEAIKRVQAENTDIEEQMLQIDTGAAKEKKKIGHRPVVPPGFRGAADIDHHRRRLRAHNDAFAAALRQTRARAEDIQRLIRTRRLAEDRDQPAIQPDDPFYNLPHAMPVGPMRHQQAGHVPAIIHHHQAHALPDRWNLMAMAPRLQPAERAQAAQAAQVPVEATRDGPGVPRLMPLPSPILPLHQAPAFALDQPWFLDPAPFNRDHDIDAWIADQNPPPVVPVTGAVGVNHFEPTGLEGIPRIAPVRPNFDPAHHAPRQAHNNGGHFIENMFAPFQPVEHHPHIGHHIAGAPGRPPFENMFGAAGDIIHAHHGHDRAIPQAGVRQMPHHNWQAYAPLFNERHRDF